MGLCPQCNQLLPTKIGKLSDLGLDIESLASHWHQAF
jgi:hypothetical protein